MGHDQSTPGSESNYRRQYNILRLSKEIDKLQKARHKELDKIKKLQDELQKELTMAHPMTVGSYQQGQYQQGPYQQGPYQQGSYQVSPQVQQPPPLQSPQSPQSPPQPPYQPSAQMPYPSSVRLGQQTGALCSSIITNGICQGSVVSANNTCKVNMQTDGNLVIYDASGSPVWSSGTNGKGVPPYRLTMQNTGNLVVQDSQSSVLWQTNTAGKGTPPYKAVMQNDCNFVIYDSNGTPIWASGTYGH